MAAISSLLKLPLPSLSRSLKFLLRLTRMPLSLFCDRAFFSSS